MLKDGCEPSDAACFHNAQYLHIIIYPAEGWILQAAHGSAQSVNVLLAGARPHAQLQAAAEEKFEP